MRNTSAWVADLSCCRKYNCRPATNARKIAVAPHKSKVKSDRGRPTKLKAAISKRLMNVVDNTRPNLETMKNQNTI